MQWNWLEGIERTKSDSVSTDTSTYHGKQEIALRTETPHLRRSKAIVVIRIELRIDWCIIHAVKLVRRNQKNKKWRRQHRHKHLPSHQEIALRIEPPHLRRSKAIGVIRIELRIDWCIIQVQQWVRRHQKNKKWRRQHITTHLLDQKNALRNESP